MGLCPANPVEIELYKKIIDLLKEKNIDFFDSQDYFIQKRKEYRNQSFYYIEETDDLGHFSPIGNALFAQQIKNLLDSKQLIPETPDYYFANFNKKTFMYFIPESPVLQLQGEMRVLSAFGFEKNNRSYDFMLSKSS